MDRNNIDWEQLAKGLLWNHIVCDKNGYSGHDLVTDEVREWEKGLPKEQIYPRGHKPGDIVGDTRILSYSIGPTKQLSWKEFAIELGLGEEFGLFPDGHDCDICPQSKKCHAYFKGDKDQERCGWWMDNMLEKQ